MSTKCSIRILFGVILCVYALMVIKQYRILIGGHRTSGSGIGIDFTALVHQHLPKFDALHDRGSSTSSSSYPPQDLDTILSKYNLTTSSDQYPKVHVPDANRTIAFLHIGKTGGSTISMNLRNGCYETYMKPCAHRQKDGWTLNETVASHRIQSYFHMGGIPPDRIGNYTTIITAVRNPISRFLSAFAYGHPLNVVATENRKTQDWDYVQKYSCFPAISYLIWAAKGHPSLPWNKAHLHKLREAQRLAPRFGRNPVKLPSMTTKNEIPPINCTELAQIVFGLNKSWTIVDERHPWTNNHMTFDYRQFYRSMPPDKELIVIRNNHLWDDWVNVNHFLSEDNEKYSRDWPSVPPFQDNHRNVSSKYVTRRRWKTQTDEEQSMLCELLHDEIRIYFMILMRAVNLDRHDLEDAIRDVEDACSGSLAGIVSANSSSLN